MNWFGYIRKLPVADESSQTFFIIAMEDRLLIERIAAVDQHEGRRQIARIAKHRFQIEDVDAGDAEVIAGAGGAMDVDRELQAAALGEDVAEDEILKRLVLGGRRHAARLYFS